MLKIYFDQKPLFICSQPNQEIRSYLNGKEAIILESIETNEIQTLLKKMETPQIVAGIIHFDEKQAFEAIKKEFLLIQAAGGLVQNKAGEVLLIFRRGKWDLPKGKLDEGEDLEQCAIREVEEETGITSLQTQGPLCITYHTYYQDGRHILKESHWYLMQTNKDQVFTPQIDEDIEKCEWVNASNLKPYMDNMHPSILDVVRQAF